MRRKNTIAFAVKAMRDYRAQSRCEHLCSVPFQGYLSFDMARALFALLLLTGVLCFSLGYFYHVRWDVLIFWGGQGYLVVCALLLLLPFWVKRLHPRSEVRQQATLMVENRKSRMLRFLLDFLLIYGGIWAMLGGIALFAPNHAYHNGLFYIEWWGHLDAYPLMQLNGLFYRNWIGLTVILWLGCEVIFVLILRYYQSHYRRSEGQDIHSFGLWLGKSTGLLAKNAHGAGIVRGKQVTLLWQDAAQNILVLGGIGSGKTTQVIHPVLAQILVQNCGGLIFDIKGNFADTVRAFAKATGQSQRLFLIGPNHLSINLIEGLTPEIAASFLKSSLMLGGASDVNRFFSDTATELCRTSLGVLSFLGQDYNLCSLYRYIFEGSYQKQIDQRIDQLLSEGSLPPKELDLLRAYYQYRQQTFEQFDDKLKGSVLASVAHILSPFNHPELIRAFCQSTECQLESVLTGSIFLVQLPLSVWGVGGKVADNFIKLRFFNVMQQRGLRPDWDQDRLVFFLCDEYQEIVSATSEGLSDLNFWDKSRSSKLMGIISTQSIKSFYAAIGNRDAADAILQNFRQKLCFRTEDQETLDYLNRLLGRVEVEKVTESRQSGSSSSSGRGGGHHRSRTQSTTLVERHVIDAQLIRNLKPNQAVGLLIIDGYSRDDVLDTLAIYP